MYKSILSHIPLEEGYWQANSIRSIGGVFPCISRSDMVLAIRPPSGMQSDLN